MQQHLWSPDLAQNRAYFEWKHERSPYLASPLIYLALYRGAVVGMRSMYGTRWEIDGRRNAFQTVCASDMVITPEHRNRGLFPLIMKAALQDLDRLGYRYIINFSASPVTFMSSLAAGWRTTPSLQAMLHRSPETTWQRIERGLRKSPVLWRCEARFSAIRSRRILSQMDRSATARSGGPVFVSTTPRPVAMIELIDRIGSDGRLRHVRDAEYLTWRYQNPLARYRFLFWEKDRLEGYLVVEQPSSIYANCHRISIVDWEGTSKQVCSDLLQTVISNTNMEEIYIWSATLSEAQRELLIENAFQPSLEAGKMSRHRPSVLVRSVRDEDLNEEWNADGKPLLDLSSWDLRLLYSL